MSLQATARNVKTKAGVCGQGELGADPGSDIKERKAPLRRFTFFGDIGPGRR